jgi:hypothetical protein
VNSAELQEINRLHNELMHEAKMTLCKAIRIGELLVAEKRKLKHGGQVLYDSRTEVPCDMDALYKARTLGATAPAKSE